MGWIHNFRKNLKGNKNMAFQKSITDQSGVVSTYWVITSAQANFSAKTVMVTIAGWLDEASYTSNLKTSSRRPFYFNIPFTSIPSAATGSISMGELYTAIAAVLADGSKPVPLSGATLVA